MARGKAADFTSAHPCATFTPPKGVTMKPNRAWIAVSLLAAALPVCAKDLNQLQALGQSEFKALSEDLDRALEGTDEQRKRITDFVESRIAR